MSHQEDVQDVQDAQDNEFEDEVEVEVEETKVVRVINFCYDRLIVPYVVAVIVLYMLELPAWKVYILAPLTLQISFILIAKILLMLYEYNVLTISWRWFKKTSKFLLGYGKQAVEWLNTNKFSRIIWFIALINLTLALWYAYKNVDLFKLLKDICELLVDLIVYFSDPDRILETLEQLLERAYLQRILIWFKTKYFIPTMYAIDEGNSVALVNISAMSFVLFLIGVFPIAVFKWFKSK